MLSFLYSQEDCKQLTRAVFNPPLLQHIMVYVRCRRNRHSWETDLALSKNLLKTCSAVWEEGTGPPTFVAFLLGHQSQCVPKSWGVVASDPQCSEVFTVQATLCLHPFSSQLRRPAFVSGLWQTPLPAHVCLLSYTEGFISCVPAMALL